MKDDLPVMVASLSLSERGVRDFPNHVIPPPLYAWAGPDLSSREPREVQVAPIFIYTSFIYTYSFIM